jgi:hypothetical protein
MPGLMNLVAALSKATIITTSHQVTTIAIHIKYLSTILAVDTIKIERGGEIMRYAFMFRMKGYLGNFKTPLNLRTATNERANN